MKRCVWILKETAKYDKTEISLILGVYANQLDALRDKRKYEEKYKDSENSYSVIGYRLIPPGGETYF